MLKRAAAAPGVLVATTLLVACGADASVSGGQEGPSAEPVPSTASSGSGTGSPDRASVPPISGPARVRLWHCGVILEGYPEGMWEMREAPFDATNAPESFTGRGTASVPRTDRLVYVDRGGQRLVFVPGDQVPPVICD